MHWDSGGLTLAPAPTKLPKSMGYTTYIFWPQGLHLQNEGCMASKPHLA